MLGASLVIFPNQCSPGEAFSNPSENRINFNLLPLESANNFNNHIGVPLTILGINRRTDLAIIEMGANHIGEIDLLCNIADPDIGYITNFGKAHLEGFGGIEGVIKGKCSSGLKTTGYVVSLCGFV